jgi:hypothetical protein
MSTAFLLLPSLRAAAKALRDDDNRDRAREGMKDTFKCFVDYGRNVGWPAEVSSSFNNFISCCVSIADVLQPNEKHGVQKAMHDTQELGANLTEGVASYVNKVTEAAGINAVVRNLSGRDVQVERSHVKSTLNTLVSNATSYASAAASMGKTAIASYAHVDRMKRNIDIKQTIPQRKAAYRLFTSGLCNLFLTLCGCGVYADASDYVGVTRESASGATD